MFIGWDVDHPKVCAVDEVFAVTGACLLIRRSIFAKTGKFDTMFGAGTYEDADLCLKISQLGYKIVVEQSATAIHVAGASVEAAKIQYPLNENFQMFVYKWQGKMPYTEWRHW